MVQEPESEPEIETLEVPEILSTPPVEVLGEQEGLPDAVFGGNSREILEVPGLLLTPVSESERRRRDIARAWIAGILGITFLVTAGWVLGTATFGGATAWTNTKDALQILLPVESSLLGSAVVFYFTGGENR